MPSLHQPPLVRNQFNPIQLPETQQISRADRPMSVIPKNRLSEQQKLVVVRQCIEAVADYKMMGKIESFAFQCQMFKCTERFDRSVEAVMGDVLIQAKVC